MQKFIKYYEATSLICREFGENTYRTTWGLTVKPGFKKENFDTLMKALKNVYITAKNPVTGRRVVKFLKSSKSLGNTPILTIFKS